MTVPTVTLTGSAAQGVHTDGENYRRAVASLPQAVRLGRKPPRPEVKMRVPHLGDFLEKKVPTPPKSTNWREKAAASMARMYLNDRYGCCVISGKAHALGVWAANDPDSGGIVLADDAEISKQYFGICGPGDNGCVITDVLDVMVRQGFTAGGKSYKLDGYCAVDWTNDLLVKMALAIGGATTIGINLPAAWTSDAVWDVTTTRIVGGHDVTPIDYDDTGVYVSSWGRIYRITWPAFKSTRWLEEMYFLAAPLWYGTDKMTPAGINAEALLAALATFKGGGIPDLGPPTPPPPPPPPPVPPSMSGPVVLKIPYLGTATGTVGPLVGRQSMAGPMGESVDIFQLLKDVGKLLTDIGNRQWLASFADFRAVLADLGVSLPFFGADQMGRALLSGHGIEAPEHMGAVPWQIIILIIQYGVKIIPIIQADIAAGKTWKQIIADVLAAIAGGGL